MIGGIAFDKVPALAGNSDADVVLHAITNAVSGITGVNILGKIADEMCQQGIADSSEYLREGLKYLKGYEISHLSVSIECKRPKISPAIQKMKAKLRELLSISENDIGITATTGEGLTDFGRGMGIQAFAIITVIKE